MAGIVSHFRARLHYGHPIIGYLLALTIVAAAGAGRFALMTGGDFRGPFLLFYPAIAASAFLAGTGPGLFSIAASALFAAAIFLVSGARELDPLHNIGTAAGSRFRAS
jgi:hypothetical protein